MDLKEKIIRRIEILKSLSQDYLDEACSTSAIIPKEVARTKWKTYKIAYESLEKDLMECNNT